MTEKEYEKVQLQIEALLQKSIQNGGFKALSSDEVALLNKLSLAAENFEDNLQMMPIKTPTTLVEMIRFKMFEMNLKQKQLANLLEISETRISELLCGKRKLNLELAKKLYQKLNIDAAFLLSGN
ncbi:MAG: helix-turn-helix domain-containing protein [Crocinitomicaceae bacterium]|jgi:HTH-type transcriptional regulator/antitoxin HigA|nr:helix-turn-helix domain-containing protein [Crocinitomicaceae bacterium]